MIACPKRTLIDKSITSLKGSPKGNKCDFKHKRFVEVEVEATINNMTTTVMTTKTMTRVIIF